VCAHAARAGVLGASVKAEDAACNNAGAGERVRSLRLAET